MFTLSQPTTGYCTPPHPPSIAGSCEVLDCQCHKILGPPLAWGPMGPHIINIMAPHWDFRAPFELALLARREVAFGTVIHVIMSNLPSKRNKGRTVFLLKNFNTIESVTMVEKWKRSVALSTTSIQDHGTGD